MKIAGLAMNDVWAHRVLRENGVSTSSVEDAPGEIVVHVDSVDLLHHGPKQRFRPYLHLSGELRAVRCETDLPYGIREVSFPPGGGERVEAYYEFTNKQLTHLVGKGYFGEAFAVPEITGIPWELPARIDALVLAPGHEGGPPVVFTGVRDIASLSIDEESSGYDIAAYFADYSYDDVVRHQATVSEGIFRTRTGEVESLFEPDEFDAPAAEADERGPAEQAERTTGIDQALADVEAGIDAYAEAWAREREATEGTPENLYRRRVAEAWEETEAEEPSASEPVPTPIDALDLDEDEAEELGVAPVKLGRHATGPTKEEIAASKRELAARVADFDSPGGDRDRGLGD